MIFRADQGSLALLNLDDYFAEVAGTLQEFECFLSLSEREDPVNYGVDLVLLIEADHLLEAILGAVNNSPEGHCPTKGQQVDIQAIFISIDLARNVADAVDQTSEGDAIEALPQSFGAANL